MPTLLQVTSFLRAVTSGKDKKLQAERDAICNACDQFVEHPVKNAWGKWIMQGFCKACGCGMRSMADINKGKHAHRSMRCPLLKWPGDAESAGMTLKEVNALFGAKERLEYNMATIQSLIDKQKPMSPDIRLQIYGHPKQAAPAEPAQSCSAKAAAVRAQGANTRPTVRRQMADAALPQAVPAEKFKHAFPNSPAVAAGSVGDVVAAVAAMKSLAEGSTAVATKKQDDAGA